jgi:hypothetical protein
MGFIKNHFINRSTLGMLKGLDPEIQSDIDFENSSRSKKVGIFLLTSLARFLAELIHIAIMALALAGLDILTRYLPNLGTENMEDLSVLIKEAFGVELSWWVFGFISFCVWGILMTVLYLLWRQVVNIVSFIYFAVNK